MWSGLEYFLSLVCNPIGLGWDLGTGHSLLLKESKCILHLFGCIDLPLHVVVYCTILQVKYLCRRIATMTAETVINAFRTLHFLTSSFRCNIGDIVSELRNLVSDYCSLICVCQYALQGHPEEANVGMMIPRGSNNIHHTSEQQRCSAAE